MKRVKILRIIARLNIGGPAIHAILLTSRLNKDKFESVRFNRDLFRFIIQVCHSRMRVSGIQMR